MPDRVLPGAVLNNANLANTILTGANLDKAALAGANLTDTNLTGAIPTGANLNSANLTRANLTKATLRDSSYSGAILSKVTWSDTVCSDGTSLSNGVGCRGTLVQGQQLEPDTMLTSPNNQYTLVLQGDGNLVLYSYDSKKNRRWAVWSTRTWESGVVRAALQDDGNFVLYTAGGSSPWASDTDPTSDKTANPGVTGPFTLVLQDDRNVVLYGADGVRWSPNTYFQRRTLVSL